MKRLRERIDAAIRLRDAFEEMIVSETNEHGGIPKLSPKEINAREALAQFLELYLSTAERVEVARLRRQLEIEAETNTKLGLVYQRDKQIVDWLDQNKPNIMCLCVFDGESVVGHTWEINDVKYGQDFRLAVEQAMKEKRNEI